MVTDALSKPLRRRLMHLHGGGGYRGQQRSLRMVRVRVSAATTRAASSVLPMAFVVVSILAVLF